MQLFGRTVIYSDYDVIDESNVIEVLQHAMPIHLKNSNQINYLYKYYKGKQCVLEREKKVHKEICNRIVENRAYEIVNFKTAYLVGKPIQYVSQSTKRSVTKGVSRFNSFLALENKAAKDKELAEWVNIGGLGYRMVMPNPDYRADSDESPFNIHVLDPRSTFIIYSPAIGNKPLACVHFITNRLYGTKFYVYTKDRFYEINDGNEIADIRPYTLGILPITEYRSNNARLGAFEPVLTILDAINDIDSNRADGIAQFIQSLAVAVNCQFDDDVTANDIYEAGLIVLKSFNDNKADFKILSEQLDQTQTQVYKEDLYKAILTIIGMPSQSNGTTSDSSNNGAVILRNGWQTAESQAENQEAMFTCSEKEFIKLALRICENLSDVSVKASDIDVIFTRRNYEDLQSKSTVLISMLNNEKVAPIDAWTTSGITPDPEEACQRGLDWYDKQQAELEQSLSEEKNNEQSL